MEGNWGFQGFSKAMLIVLVVATLFVCIPYPSVAADSDHRLTPVTLQLKWKHQFQFAGYYAAVENGYYKEEGLAVSLRESRPGVSVIDEVTHERAQFGVTDSEIVLAFAKGKPVVVLGAIFQHSPAILLSRMDSKIHSPSDLRGKNVMYLGPSEAEIRALLMSENIRESELKQQTHTWNIDDLIERRTDAMSAYLTDQPYAMKLKEIPANIMRPLSFGVDFYGDCLFTSKNLSENDPDMVERFSRASFKGWEYAMAHTEEIAALIISKYNSKASYAHLMFEAEAMREIILPKLIQVGNMNPKRWRHIADIYSKVGLLESELSLKGFMHEPQNEKAIRQFSRWFPYVTALSILIIMVVLALLVFNRKLQKGIQTQTAELDRNRQSLRQVLDLVPSMVSAKNREGKFLLVNKSVADSLGTTTEALTGKYHRDVHPDKLQVQRMLADDQIIFDTGIPKVNLEEPYKYADGSIHWLQTTRLPYMSAETGEPAVLILSVDITNNKLADDALKKSEEKFRAIFNQTYQFTGITELDGTLIQTNQTSLDAFCLSYEDVIGKKFWETPWWETADISRDWVRNAVLRAASGETVRTETGMTTPDGTKVFYDFSIKPGRNVEGEIVFLIPEAHDITSLKESEAELRKLNEELEKRVEIRTHHLAQAKEELEASIEQLQQTQQDLILSEKLAALGGLVAGVAHEINTPLGIGVTASSFLEGKLNELSDKFETGDLKRSDLEKFIRTGKESASNVLVNLNRAAELVKSFKQVAADQSSEQPRVFDIKHYVDEVLLSLRPKYKRTNHTILNNCHEIEMFSYPGAFMQIITNLLLNSLTHAYEEGDSGTISIGAEEQGTELVFTFSDDGKGIPTESMDKIFEPFYTTKRNEGGTGLGLHIVFNTVTQALGGIIHFESAPGAGTTYTITMPLTKTGHDQA